MKTIHPGKIKGTVVGKSSTHISINLSDTGTLLWTYPRFDTHLEVGDTVYVAIALFKEPNLTVAVDT